MGRALLGAGNAVCGKRRLWLRGCRLLTHPVVRVCVVHSTTLNERRVCPYVAAFCVGFCVVGWVGRHAGGALALLKQPTTSGSLDCTASPSTCTCCLLGGVSVCGWRKRVHCLRAWMRVCVLLCGVHARGAVSCARKAFLILACGTGVSAAAPSGHVTLRNVTVVNCTATLLGGGVAIGSAFQDAVAFHDGLEVSGCTARLGGGVWIGGQALVARTLRLQGVAIRDCVAVEGGGLAVTQGTSDAPLVASRPSSDVTVTLADAVVSSNRAELGGGVLVASAVLTMLGSVTCAHNMATSVLATLPTAVATRGFAPLDGTQRVTAGGVPRYIVRMGGAVLVRARGVATLLPGVQCTSNTAETGGAVASVDSTVRLHGVRLVNNTAVAEGGAVAATFQNLPHGSTLQLVNCSLQGNAAARGGAVWADVSNGTVAGCMFDSNTAASRGGHLLIGSGGDSATTPACTMNAGVEVASVRVNVTVSTTTFARGRAGNDGGAVYVGGCARAQMGWGVAFVHNRARRGAGLAVASPAKLAVPMFAPTAGAATVPSPVAVDAWSVAPTSSCSTSPCPLCFRFNAGLAGAAVFWQRPGVGAAGEASASSGVDDGSGYVAMRTAQSQWPDTCFANNSLTAPATAAPSAPFPFDALTSTGQQAPSGYGYRLATQPVALRWLPADHALPSGVTAAVGGVTLLDALNQTVTWTPSLVDVRFYVGPSTYPGTTAASAVSGGGGGGGGDRSSNDTRRRRLAVAALPQLSGGLRQVVDTAGVATLVGSVTAAPDASVQVCAATSLTTASTAPTGAGPGVMVTTACTFFSMGACPAGTGLPASAPAGPPACQACDPGTFGSGAGATCEACAAGRVSKAGATTCSDCPVGAIASLDGTTCAGCPSSTFALERMTSCLTCPYCDCCGPKFGLPGVDVTCSGGMVYITDGLWWDESMPPHEATFYACKPGRCFLQGNHTLTSRDTAISFSCADRYMGPLCEVCETGSVKSGHHCVGCWPRWVNAMLVGGGVLLGTTVLVVMSRLRSQAVLDRNAVIDLARTNKAVHRRLQALDRLPAPVAVARVVMNFCQLMGALSLFKIGGPQAFRDLMGPTDAAGGSLIEFYPVACLLRWTYAQRFYATTSLPLVIFVFAGALAAWRKWADVRRQRQRQQRQQEPHSPLVHRTESISGGDDDGDDGGNVATGASLRLRFLSNSTALLFFVYAIVSRTVISAHGCRPINGVPRLMADMSVDCSTDAHAAVSAVAWLGIVVWVIGIPAASVYVVYLYRKRLDRPYIASSLSFLVNAYRIPYWEAVVKLRVVLVICASVYVPDPIIAVVTATGVVSMALFAQLVVRPFNSPWLNFMETASLLMTQLVQFAGIVHAQLPATTTYSIVYSVLMTTPLILFFVAAVLTGFYVVRQVRTAKLELARTVHLARTMLGDGTTGVQLSAIATRRRRREQSKRDEFGGGGSGGESGGAVTNATGGAQKQVPVPSDDAVLENGVINPLLRRGARRPGNPMSASLSYGHSTSTEAESDSVPPSSSEAVASFFHTRGVNGGRAHRVAAARGRERRSNQLRGRSTHSSS